jgi:iron complex transport system substrate-binding protein
MSRHPGHFVLALLALALLSSCSPAAVVAPASSSPAPAAPVAPPSPATPAAAQPAANSGQAFPFTLKDDLGRELTLPVRPTRLVSLSPAATEVLFAIGAGAQVVGVTQYCTYPADARTGREIVGGFSPKSISMEKIVALKPDLVFSSGSLQKPIIEALDAAKIPVVALEPKDLKEVEQRIRTAGQITGHATEAEAVVAKMQSRADAVTQITAKIPAEQRVKVFYEVWDEPLTTAGPSTFVGQLIEMAGGVNIFADVKEQYPTISVETVLQRNPDVIMAPDTHANGMTAELIAARPGWGTLKAVTGKRVYFLNGDMGSRAGPRLVDALESAARSLYPDRFR